MRHQSTDESMRVLSGALGSTVSEVSRVYYELAGSLDESTGALEIAFEGGLRVHFDCGSDGESLLVFTGEWVDPFVEPLSAENLAFINESGKWTKVDRSASPGYDQLVGSVFRDYSGHILEDERLTGVTMKFDNFMFVRVQCIADELIVDLAG